MKEKVCKICGSKWVVNRTYSLCQIHNEERLNKQHPDRKKKTKPIKSISKKQSVIETKYRNVLREIDENREKICSGCGRYQGGDVRLSHSHIISRADCKRIGKPQLIYHPENITYHCMDFGFNQGCHSKWENPTKRHLLLDYWDNLHKIKKLAPELYNKYRVDKKN